jgi:hypothetical protein
MFSEPAHCVAVTPLAPERSSASDIGREDSITSINTVSHAVPHDGIQCGTGHALDDSDGKNDLRILDPSSTTLILGVGKKKAWTEAAILPAASPEVLLCTEYEPALPG